MKKGHIKVAALMACSVAAILVATRILLGTSFAGAAKSIWGKDGLTDLLGRGLEPLFLIPKSKDEAASDRKVNNFKKALLAGSDTRQAFLAAGINPTYPPGVLEKAAAIRTKNDFDIKTENTLAQATASLRALNSWGFVNLPKLPVFKQASSLDAAVALRVLTQTN